MIPSSFGKYLFKPFVLGAAILCLPALAHATAFSSLGSAQDFALLSVSGGINQSGAGSGAKLNAVQGNIGVAASSTAYNGSGTLNDTGNIDILTSSTFHISSNGATGTVTQNAATNTLLQNAVAGADITSAWASALGLDPTASFGTILNSTTISEKTAGQYVIDLAGINLANGSTLTLSAPTGSTFILDVGNSLLGGAFNLSSASIVLSGGLTANDVLFNVLGSGSVNLANNSTVDGIILALSRSVNMAGGLVNGDVIASNANLSGGASILDPPPPTVVPEANTGLVLIPFIGLVLLLSARHVFRPKAEENNGALAYSEK
jgi:hypothetical protein